MSDDDSAPASDASDAESRYQRLTGLLLPLGAPIGIALGLLWGAQRVLVDDGEGGTVIPWWIYVLVGVVTGLAARWYSKRH